MATPGEGTNQSTFMQEPTILFNHIACLAQHFGKHVAIYDLECTTFRGRPNFGITELSCFFVSPEGECATVGSLVNPEHPIDARVVTLTGITQKMVAGQPTWGHQYARMFSNMAEGECWVAGFNNASFDNPAVMEINHRYGKPIKAFKHTFDVRTLHLRLSRASSQAGTLAGVAALYGVHPRGELHRAQADVALTAELLNAIIERFGLEAVVAQIEAGPTSSKPPVPAYAAPDVPTYALGTLRPPREGAAPSARGPSRSMQVAAALVGFLQDNAFRGLKHLSEALGSDEQSLSYAVGQAIDAGAIAPQAFAVEPAQAWLAQELKLLDPAVLAQGKLRPIHDVLALRSPQGHLDYIQLRVALLAAGQRWSTFRPQGQAA